MTGFGTRQLGRSQPARVLDPHGDSELAEAALQANYGLGRKLYERAGEALGVESVYLEITTA